MKIMLRNRKVRTKLIAKSLKKTQLDWYRPRFLVSFFNCLVQLHINSLAMNATRLANYFQIEEVLNIRVSIQNQT